MTQEQLEKWQLLIGHKEYYTTIVGSIPSTGKPEWFDIDQKIALSIIYKNMTQTHIFPMDKNMFKYMKPQYKTLFTKALAWQIKYINDNQDLYDNPAQYLASHTLGTSSTGPISQAELDALMDVLAPKAKYYLEQMGWTYTSLVDHYELSQFYDEEIDDEYALVSYVDQKFTDANAYTDVSSQEVKDWVEDSYLQDLEGFDKNKHLITDAEGKIKWNDNTGGVTQNYVDTQDATVLETATTRIDEMGEGKIDLLGKEAGSGESYHFPYNFDASIVDSTTTAGRKSIKVGLDTITLDNLKTLKHYDKELELPELGKVDDVKVKDSTGTYSVVTDKIATVDLSKYIELLGDEVYSHGPYHFPYHMTLTPAADKITATAYTITLDNNKSLNNYSFDLPAATTSQAGIMTATDKTALNNKVDKTTTNSQLYGTKKEGGVVIQTTLGYSNTPNPSHIVKYDNAGRVRVDNSNLDASGNENCATPVSYVKSNFATISNLTNEATLRTQGDGNLQTQINALASVARVEVVTVLPTTLVNNTIYYVGTTSPYHIYLRANDTTYDLGTTEIDLSGYEKTANKTGTISASSTVEQYPNAKAVYDYGNPMNIAITNLTTSVTNLTNNKLDASKCTYQTTVPTAAKTDGGVHIVYLETEPTTKYAGYIYFIK